MTKRYNTTNPQYNKLPNSTNPRLQYQITKRYNTIQQIHVTIR